jgi:hypothetical protein
MLNWPTMKRPYAIATLVALFTSGCDLSSKHWAIQTTARGPRSVIPGALDLVHWENPGMAFSLMRTWPPGIRMWLLSVAAVVAIVLGMVVVARRPMALTGTIGIGLIMGGALETSSTAHNGTIADSARASRRVRLASVQRRGHRRHLRRVLDAHRHVKSGAPKDRLTASLCPCFPSLAGRHLFES